MEDYKNKQYISQLSTSLENGSFYTLVIKADSYDSSDRYIMIDYIDGSPTINEKSIISQYPLVNGTPVSDHQYNMPISISFRGAFSLNGKFNDTFTTNELLGDRLENIISYFRDVKEHGRMIDFMFVLNGNERYEIIRNLVLQDFTWNPGINSFVFSMTLQQIYFADFSDFDLLENELDPYLPTLASFKNANFVGEVIDTEYLYEEVIKMLCDEDLIASSFVEVLAISGKAYFVSLGVAVAVATAIVAFVVYHAVTIGITAAIAGTATASIFAGVGTALGATLPWSVIIVAAAAVVGGIIYGVVKLVRMCKRKNWIKQFQGYATTTENEEEQNRFMKFLSSVETSVNKIKEQVQFYSFSSNNKKQEYSLTINDNIYIFRMEKETNNSLWSMTIMDANDNIIGNNTAQYHSIKGLANILDATNADALFTFEDGTKLFVLNKALILLQLDKQTIMDQLEDSYYKGLLTNDNVGDNKKVSVLTQEQKEELYKQFTTYGVYQDLTKYMICITKADISKLREAMMLNIRDVMENWANTYE